ncbi:SusC/RagA family TonB-linked outer membrane protein [Flavobacteriaceae bacterium R33]|uniref:SusC/RagA family TonB-linked outer membrane protein n=2 Tax=Poritiphilus flavus TaxID=2697053 RepID=A0A6L9EE30_9FLAO|nr:SusC/RagA family TonB-linked outer membrane protein [Poritiphilus flavus]
MKRKWTTVSFWVLSILFSFGQEKTISGKVTDSNNLPLPGVTVIIEGTTRGVQTDFDGNYSIRASNGETLLFTYIGKRDVSSIIGASNVINVMMEESAEALEEVVVTAYGTSRKEDFTGSANVVRATDFELRAATSPITALEGAATGVQIISSSGQPGSGPGIVIRGVGTLNGVTAPLYIVDGMQFEGSLASINQDDIQSMTVLKDAASTALYGSRASNGVVIITTKKGRQDSPVRVNFSSQYGFITQAIDEYDFVSPGQYYELMWEAYKNALGGDAVEASATIYSRLGYNPFNVANDAIVDTNGNLNPNAQVVYQSLNWYDVLERTGSRKNHSLSITGGSQRSQVFFSASYLKEDGYVIESDFERLTTRLNADFDAADWLKVGGSVNLTFAETNGPDGAGTTSIVNPFGFAKDMGSIYPVYLEDTNGDYVLDAEGQRQFDLGEGYSDYNIQSRPNNPGRHAIAEAIFNDNLDRTNTIGFRYYADIRLLDGLNFKVNYGQDIQDGIDKEYENNIVGDGAPTGRYGETRFRRTVENFNQILTYNRSINNVHNVDLTLGHESFDRNYSENSGLSNTQTAEGIYEFVNFSVPTDLSGYTSDKTLEGYFARLNYNFDNKYYLSASARRDGSSVFDQDVRWGNFYSIGGSWRVDQENFMENIGFINQLKIRGSYGEVGNDRLLVSGSTTRQDFYISQPRYEITSNAGAPAIFWSNLGNSTLTWEASENWDLAVEFGLFNNFLDGTFEYYNKTSSDLLYNLPIALSNGLNEKPENIGTIVNDGYELSLTGHMINTANFKWDMSLQASTFKNEITELPTPFVLGSKRWDEGRSRYDFYIFDYAGVDPDNGNSLYFMYEDDPDTEERIPVLNDDGSHATTNDWQEAGRAYVDASAVPDIIGSVRNAFSYRGLDLDFLITYSIGGEILDYGYADMMHEGEYGVSLHVDQLDAWRAPGDITNVPRLENGNVNQFQRMSTRFLTDATFYALRNANLSYSFEKRLTDKLGLNSLRLFVSGENLYIKTKRRGLNAQYNLAGTPSGNDYNPNRVVSLGLNVSF